LALRDVAGVPNDVRDYFEAVLLMNGKRNTTLYSALREIISELNDIDAEPVVLKGALTLLEGLYPDRSARVVGDIDLLVKKGALHRASSRLIALGYRVQTPDLPTKRWFTAAPMREAPSHHLPVQIHERTGIGVELHHELFLPPYQALLSSPGAIDRRHRVTQSGLTYAVLHPTDRVIHNVAHAQLHHPRHEDGGIELRQLVELALIARAFAAEIDWAEVDARFEATGYGNIVRDQRALASSLLGCELPGSLGDPFRCLDRLRRFIVAPPMQGGPAVVMKGYWRGFLENPARAVNLLNPMWWPQRLSFHRISLRRHRKW
jgi:hypothetical protein